MNKLSEVGMGRRLAVTRVVMGGEAPHEEGREARETREGREALEARSPREGRGERAAEGASNDGSRGGLSQAGAEPVIENRESKIKNLQLEGPGLAKRVGNLARDMTTVLKLFFGNEKVLEDAEQVAANLRVCAGDAEAKEAACALWRPFKMALKMGLRHYGICLHEECGCIMGFKARLKGMGCPLGKWKKVVSGEW